VQANVGHEVIYPDPGFPTYRCVGQRTLIHVISHNCATRCATQQHDPSQRRRAGAVRAGQGRSLLQHGPPPLQAQREHPAADRQQPVQPNGRRDDRRGAGRDRRNPEGLPELLGALRRDLLPAGVRRGVHRPQHAHRVLPPGPAGRGRRLLEDLQHDGMAPRLRRVPQGAGRAPAPHDHAQPRLHGRLHADRRLRGAGRAPGLRGRDGGGVPGERHPNCTSH
jgi:hypothetical protein